MAALEAVGSTYVAGSLIATTAFLIIPVCLIIRHKHAHAASAVRSVALPAGIEIVGRVDHAAAIAVAVAAYSSNPLFTWIIQDDTRQWLIAWLVHFYIASSTAAANGTVILAARGDDGSIAAMAVVVPYLYGMPGSAWWSGGVPPILSSTMTWLETMVRLVPKHGRGLLAGGSPASLRFKAARTVMAREHVAACYNGRPHLHVALLAVHPAGRDKKLASRLMRHINTCADELGCACYLGCFSDEHRAICTRFGYAVADLENYTIQHLPDQPRNPAINPTPVRIEVKPRSVAGATDACGSQPSFADFWSMERSLHVALDVDAKDKPPLPGQVVRGYNGRFTVGVHALQKSKTH